MLLEGAEKRENPEKEVAFADGRGKGGTLGEVEDDGATDSSGGLNDLRVEREKKRRYGVGLEHHGHVVDANASEYTLRD